MSVCVVVDSSNIVRATAETTCSEFLLLSQSELTNIQNGSVTQIISTLNELFAFDLATFGIVHGSLMLAFLGGHFTGRIVKYFGKK